MLSRRNGRLFIEDVSVELLARSFGTPLFVYGKDRLARNFLTFDAAFRRSDHLVCYALKANSNAAVLRILSGLGAGVDITSGGELYRAERAGFPPQRTVYAGIGKTPEEIEYALRQNILLFNVESMEELAVIDRVAGRLRRRAAIAFRINPHVDPHTHRYITTGTSGSKFGIPYRDAPGAYRAARRMKHIDVAGIHCHIGSQITRVEPFALAARRVASLVADLAAAGIRLKYVDMGGGLGIRYRNERPPAPAALAAALRGALKGFSGTLILEPGRYIAGDAGILVARVVYRKRADGKNFLVVDAGMNDLVRPTLYEAYHAIEPVSGGRRAAVRADVVGPICETGDFLGLGRVLPRLAQGEHIAVRCAGAYGFAMSSQYNSRLRAAEVMVDGREFFLARRRDRYDDLTAAEL